jgi:hypothetical protein
VGGKCRVTVTRHSFFVHRLVSPERLVQPVRLQMFEAAMD